MHRWCGQVCFDYTSFSCTVHNFYEWGDKKIQMEFQGNKVQEAAVSKRMSRMSRPHSECLYDYNHTTQSANKSLTCRSLLQSLQLASGQSPPFVTQVPSSKPGLTGSSGYHRCLPPTGCQFQTQAEPFCVAPVPAWAPVSPTIQKHAAYLHL